MGQASPVGWGGVSFICVVAAVTLAVRAHNLPLAPLPGAGDAGAVGSAAEELAGVGVSLPGRVGGGGPVEHGDRGRVGL